MKDWKEYKKWLVKNHPDTANSLTDKQMKDYFEKDIVEDPPPEPKDTPPLTELIKRLKEEKIKHTFKESEDIEQYDDEIDLGNNKSIQCLGRPLSPCPFILNEMVGHSCYHKEFDTIEDLVNHIKPSNSIKFIRGDV